MMWVVPEGCLIALDDLSDKLREGRGGVCTYGALSSWH